MEAVTVSDTENKEWALALVRTARLGAQRGVRIEELQARIAELESQVAALTETVVTRGARIAGYEAALQKIYDDYAEPPDDDYCRWCGHRVGRGHAPI